MLDTATATAQPWNAARVTTFAGQFDTHISTGEDYTTISLADLFVMEPLRSPKGAGPAIIPSTYNGHDAREHASQRERGQFVMLCGDVDSGNHDLVAIQQAAEAFAPDHACLIFTSAHARPGDLRWRILLPLANASPFHAWHDAQTAFFAFMEARGIAIDHALARAAQPVYLPNVPDIHGKSKTALRGDDGAPLFYASARTTLDKPGIDITTGYVAAGIAAIRTQRADDEQERERIRREAEKRRAMAPRGDGASLIDDFNAANSVATMLEICGYEQSPRNPDDWRSTYQTSDSYATRVIGSKWVSLSASDASAGVGQRCKAGCFGDAYDLFVHFKHGGDQTASFRALHQERRAAHGENVIYPREFEAQPVPDWMTEAPGYDEMPDWIEQGADFEEPVVDQARPQAARKSLAFEWAGQAEPVIDGFWLVEDWLPKSGIAAVYGHPGSGKSFFTIDIAAHVAAGVPWNGKEIERGLVVYVIAEGQNGFRNRLYAMQQSGRIARDAPFIFIPTPIDLQAPDGDIEPLTETISIACEQAGIQPALVVIDTLSKTFGAGKENTDDMVGYLNNCQRIASQFDCLSLIVHHRPKDSESRDLRGHSSLRGNIDTAILIEAGLVKTATTIKQKDGEDNLHARFQLDRVVIGFDKKGKEVSTCLVEMVEGAAPQDEMPHEERKKARLTGHKKTALNAIEEIIAKDGREPPHDIPPDAINRYRSHRAADATLIRERLKNEFLAMEDGEEDKRKENARRNTNRALKDLKSDGIIGTWGDWIWIN